MKVLYMKNTETKESMLRITVENKRQEQLLMSLFGTYTQDVLALVNNPKTTHLTIGEENPFTYDEVKDLIDSVFREIG